MHLLSTLYNVKTYNRYGVGGKHFLSFVLWRPYKNKNKNLLVMWLEALHFPRSLLTSTTHIDLNSDLRQSCNRYESFDIRAILWTCYVICDDENWYCRAKERCKNRALREKELIITKSTEKLFYNCFKRAYISNEAHGCYTKTDKTDIKTINNIVLSLGTIDFNLITFVFIM